MTRLLFAFLCRLGWHKWETVFVLPDYCFGFKGKRSYHLCMRCKKRFETFTTDTILLRAMFLCLLAIGCGSEPSVETERKADKVVSLDLLGILHPDFPCEKYLEMVEGADEIHFGYLAGGTFGRQRQCLDSYLEDRRTRAVRVHLCSGPCVTNDRCHPDECLYGTKWGSDDLLLSRLEREAEYEFSLLSAYQGRIYASPVLEHQLPPTAFDRAADILYRLASEYGLEIEVVDNPLFPRPSKYLLEVHNEFASPQFPYIFSTDGYFGFDVQSMLDANKDALISFEWRPEFNGLCTDGSPWVFPTERRCW